MRGAPQPLTGSEPRQPALSRDQASTIIAGLRTTMARADRLQDATLAGTVLTGPKAKADLVLHQVTHAAAGVPWLVSLAGSVPATSMVAPATPVDAIADPVSVSTPVNGVRPDGLSRLLVAALRAPGGKQARTFSRDPRRLDDAAGGSFVVHVPPEGRLVILGQRSVVTQYAVS